MTDTEHDIRIVIDLDATDLVTGPDGGEIPELINAIRVAVEDHGLDEDQFDVAVTDLPGPELVYRYATFITGHPDATPDARHLAAVRAIIGGMLADGWRPPISELAAAAVAVDENGTAYLADGAEVPAGEWEPVGAEATR